MTRAEQEIESKLKELWRDLDKLVEEADAKRAHMKTLFEHRQTPLMTSDLPTNCWMRISETIFRIAQLKELQCEIKRPKFRPTARKAASPTKGRRGSAHA